MNKPGSTGFFLCPIDPDNPQSRAPHDLARSYTLAPFERIVDPRTFQQLKQRVGGGRLAIAGLYPEESAAKKFEMIVGGETVFFINKTELAATATIIYTERSRHLAEQFFGQGSPGAHELLLLLAAVDFVNYPIELFCEAIGRKSRAAVKGFTTLAEANIRAIDDRFGSVYGFLEAVKNYHPKPAGETPV